MKKIKITIGRHSFRVRVIDGKYKNIVDKFNLTFRTYKKVCKKIRGRFIFKKEIDRDYVVKNDILREYFYTITSLQAFVQHLRHNNVVLSDLDIKYKTKPHRFKVDIPTSNNFILRDYQVKYINTMSKNIKKNPTFLVDLQTGKGKTLIACHTISKIGYRTVVLVKGQFVDKWRKDLKNYFDITDDDIFVVRGRDSLKELMEMDVDDIPKFVIFSSRTIQLYIESFETLQIQNHFSYKFFPNELLEKLNISIMLIDETHKEFHLLYKSVLALDPTLLIGLSATLLHKDKKMNMLYELLYPENCRLSYLELDKYAYVKALAYRMNINKNFKYMLPSHGYSQTEFELSIIRNFEMLRFFINMFIEGYKEYYLPKDKEGKKCMIFLGSIQMCTIFSEVFKQVFPDKIVKRYVGEDDYDDMLNGDIIITTPGSSGEAIDIPGLLTVLSAVATDSVQKNIQMLGRLREDKDGDRVDFIYYYDTEIPQHKKYHENRRSLFEKRVVKQEFGLYQFYYTKLNKFKIKPELLRIKKKK